MVPSQNAATEAKKYWERVFGDVSNDAQAQTHALPALRAHPLASLGLRRESRDRTRKVKTHKKTLQQRPKPVPERRKSLVRRREVGQRRLHRIREPRPDAIDEGRCIRREDGLPVDLAFRR